MPPQTSGQRTMLVRLLLGLLALVIVGAFPSLLPPHPSSTGEPQVVAAPPVAPPTLVVASVPTLTPTLPLDAFPGPGRIIVEDLRAMLQDPNLDPEDRRWAEERIAFQEIEARRLEEARIARLTATIDRDALPTVGPSFTSRPAPTGIFEEFPWVFKADDLLIENMWQNYLEGDLVEVYAGVMAQDNTQGIVVVTGYWPTSTRRGGAIPRPAKPGRCASPPSMACVSP